MQAIIAYPQLEIRRDCQAGCDTQMVISPVPSSTAFASRTERSHCSHAEVCPHPLSSSKPCPRPTFGTRAKSSHLRSAHYCAPASRAPFPRSPVGRPAPGFLTHKEAQRFYEVTFLISKPGKWGDRDSNPSMPHSPKAVPLASSPEPETQTRSGPGGQDSTNPKSLVSTLKSPINIPVHNI